MLYVSSMKRESTLVKSNKQGGCTVAIAKRGGYSQAWLLARHLAGWEIELSAMESNMLGLRQEERFKDN